jgi:predicted type IV restriction endonuclease
MARSTTLDNISKKGEKVDYVILLDRMPIILFECKSHNADLDRQHPTQLYRYFSVLEARFAVLTNGITYRFFTDLEEKNKLDSKSFFEFNMLDIHEAAVEELKKFTKSAFDLDQNVNAATLVSGNCGRRAGKRAGPKQTSRSGRYRRGVET